MRCVLYSLMYVAGEIVFFFLRCFFAFFLALFFAFFFALFFLLFFDSWFARKGIIGNFIRRILLPADVIENHTHARVLIRVLVFINACQWKQKAAHGFHRCVIDAAWLVGHDTLSERVYAVSVERVSNLVDNIIVDGSVRAKLVWIVRPWRVYKGEVAHLHHLHWCCHCCAGLLGSEV